MFGKYILIRGLTFCLILLTTISNSFSQSVTSFRGLHLGQSRNDAFSLLKKMGFNLDIQFIAVVKMPNGTLLNSFECRNKQGTNSFTTDRDVVVELTLKACFFDFDTFDASLFRGAVANAYKLTNWRASGTGTFADTPFGEVVELNTDGYRRPYIVVKARPVGRF